MAQHAFRCKHHQWFSPLSERLSPQQMKVLRRGRRLANLEVVAGSKLQKAFNSSARVFRALSFIAVGQEQYQAREQVPLEFTGNDELINDRLRNIGKVAELRLPKHQGLRIIAAVTILEPENAGFREG